MLIFCRCFLIKFVYLTIIPYAMKRHLWLILSFSVSCVFAQNVRVAFETSAKDSNAYAPAEVEFYNQTQNESGETVVYAWDFGDGGSAAAEHPTHVYQRPGTYFVTLTARTSGGTDYLFGADVVVKDSAQRNEFDFITSDALYTGSDIPEWGNRKNYLLRNDSVIVYGYYVGNCGARKTATLDCCEDTIRIQTWEVGVMTSCVASYAFEIGLPYPDHDSVVVVFNDKRLTQPIVSLDVPVSEPSLLSISPNPVSNRITCSLKGVELAGCAYRIYNAEGRCLMAGRLDEAAHVDLPVLKPGVYFLSLAVKNVAQPPTVRFISHGNESYEHPVFLFK